MTKKHVPTLDIRRFDGDRDAFVREIGVAYREFGFCGISGHGIAPALIDRIRSGLKTEDLPGLAQPAHALKGSLSQFAAAPAVTCAQRLEEAAHSRDPVRAAALSAQLENELARFATELRQFLNEL